MLLFVDGSGKMVTIRRFKGLLTAVALLLAVLTATSAGLWYLYTRSAKTQRNLANALTVARHEAKTLRGEKETLSAKLALAAANVETLQPRPGQEHRDPSRDFDEPETNGRAVGEEPVSDDPEPLPEAAPGPEPIPSETPESDASAEYQGPMRVAVEGLKITRDKTHKRLEVKFTLKNTDADAEPVSGYSFVVLKERGGDASRWYVFPNMDLVSGRPSQVKGGRYFQISRFKTIAFDTEADIRPEAISAATIMIYSRSGELILEKDFDLDEAS